MDLETAMRTVLEASEEAVEQLPDGIVKEEVRKVRRL